MLRYTIPNSFTALSLLLGVASIVTTQLGDLELAGWIIVWCGLLDVLDGVSARLLKATSSFGAEFDSMADLVSFGVAPAVLVLNAGLQIGDIEVESGQFWVLAVAVAVFVLAGAMRLARFNVASEETTHGWFSGVPITATGGGLISSIVLVLIHHDDIAELLPLHLYFPVLMFVLAILMVSRIRFPKATRRKSNFINVFQIVSIAGIYYCGITRTYPEYLLGIGLFLMIAGIIAGRITRDI
ncbi:MAG: CDP-diacylglycerol--serine O-phosphatidyltransferase [Proteobacteria bacterium]|nr:CDP-diacylglycerol--serine O-phosphatidyltransferase [Pseudomonadota bacterium]MCH9006082.1 CDP-diacylglycerol--serine O-phosphatidyltransferase [Pseudomonadota bacterium]